MLRQQQSQNKIIMTHFAQKSQSPLKKLINKQSNLCPKKEVYDSDDSEIHDQTQNKVLIKKFKYNQHELRNKFKKYIDKQKNLFPLTHLKLKDRKLDQSQSQDYRKIRKEKSQIIEDMNRSMNQSKYYMHKKDQFEKTYHLLERKVERVNHLRTQRKSEVVKLQSTLRSISEEIMKEKLKYKRSIDSSKGNLVRSRIQFQQKKTMQADNVRYEKELFKQKINSDRQSVFLQNRLKCQTVRDDQKKVQLNVSRIYEEKRSIAQQVKLERLFRELAEKQEVKIESARVKLEAKSRIGKFKDRSVLLEEKIQQYRKGLGQRRLQSSKHSLLRQLHRRSITQPRENSTSKSGFLSANHYETDSQFDD